MDPSLYSNTDLIAHFRESRGFTRPPMVRIQVCGYTEQEALSSIHLSLGRRWSHHPESSHHS